MPIFEKDCVSITVRGTAASVFTKATFQVKIVTSAETGPQAKGLAQPTIEAFKAAVVGMADAARVDLSRMQASFDVALVKKYHDNMEIAAGYQAIYVCSFAADNVAAAVELHDRLTSIPGVQAESPQFLVDSEHEVAAVAFKDAYSRAHSQFLNQCGIMGVDSKMWRMSSWHVQDRVQRGKGLRFDESLSKPKAVGLQPGDALLDIQVTFTWHRGQLTQLVPQVPLGNV